MDRQRSPRTLTESRGARLSARRHQSQRRRKGALLGMLILAGVAALLLTLALFGGSSTGENAAREAPVIALDGIIDQVSADYATRVIREAEESGAPVVILRIDSSGGRQDAAREVIDAIASSPLPVVAWVGPEGARSASMGTLVFCAADVAALAPGARLDTVIPEDVHLSREEVDGLADQARSLTELNGRNPDWAELAVRQPLALDAESAVSLRAADLEAASPDELLDLIDARETAARKITIQTAGISPVPASMNLLERSRHLLVQPAIAWLILLGAGLAAVLALARPGLKTLLPAAGLVLPAIYAAFAVPVRPAGAGLLLIGVALAATPVWFRSFGLLPAGGLACLLISPMFFFASTAPWLEVPALVILPAAAAAVAFLVLVARAGRITGGADKAGVVGATGYTRTRLTPLGQVDLDDRTWSAESADGRTIEKGEEVQVVAASSHILKVRRLT